MTGMYDDVIMMSCYIVCFRPTESIFILNGHRPEQ